MNPEIKARYAYYLVPILISLIYCALSYVRPNFMESIEGKLYDFLFVVRGQLAPPDNIVIAAIDESSIQRLGRWPWPRDKFAHLVKKLAEFDASVIAFDIIFSEPEKNDYLLSQSIEEAGCVILPLVFFFDKEDTIERKEINDSSLLIRGGKGLSKYFFLSSKSVLVPCRPLIRAASGVGHINVFPDSDGTIRKEALYIEYRGRLYPSLALKTAAYYLGIPQERVVVEVTKGIQLGKRYIRTDAVGRILIPYYGGNETFKHIPIVDILEGKTKREQIEGKIVLVGATAVGIYDLRVTPTSSALPGVEKQANVIASLISGRTLIAVPNCLLFAIILFSGILTAYLYRRIKAAYALLVLLVALLVIFSLSYSLFLRGVWLSYFYTSSNVIAQYIVTVAVRYAISEREARRIRKIFSSYVTERVVNELIRNPSKAKLGGERREVTILFCDIRGFTSFSEKRAPEDVVSLLNEYFGKMTEIILKWEGTLDKFMGDAIMVFWGAPLEQPDHAERAVKCALEMTRTLRELGEEWEKKGKPALKIGVGINTGEALVGNIGAEGKKMDYTVIGDHVNLASRLEGLNKSFGSEIIISEYTLERIKDKIHKGIFGGVLVRGLGNVAVKGRERPVKIYSVQDVPLAEPQIMEREEKESPFFDA